MQLKMARAPLLAYGGHASAASLARYARVSPEPSAAGRHSTTRHGAGRLGNGAKRSRSAVSPHKWPPRTPLSGSNLVCLTTPGSVPRPSARRRPAPNGLSPLPALGELLTAARDPARGIAGGIFDTLGASRRNEITRDDLLAVTLLGVRWSPSAVWRLLGEDTARHCPARGDQHGNEPVGGQRQSAGGHRSAGGSADEGLRWDGPGAGGQATGPQAVTARPGHGRDHRRQSRAP